MTEPTNESANSELSNSKTPTQTPPLHPMKMMDTSGAPAPEFRLGNVEEESGKLHLVEAQSTEAMEAAKEVTPGIPTNRLAVKSSGMSRSPSWDGADTRSDAGSDSDLEMSEMFRALDPAGSGIVTIGCLVEHLEECGISMEDPRLSEMRREMREIERIKVRRSITTAYHTGKSPPRRLPLRMDTPLHQDEFERCVMPVSSLVTRALRGHLIVPEWAAFCQRLVKIFENVNESTYGGDVADYIPELANVDPSKFGVAVCTVDGQLFTYGDTAELLCVQSCSKPISYLMAVEEHGEELVNYYGCD